MPENEEYIIFPRQEEETLENKDDITPPDSPSSQSDHYSEGPLPMRNFSDIYAQTSEIDNPNFFVDDINPSCFCLFTDTKPLNFENTNSKKEWIMQ